MNGRVGSIFVAPFSSLHSHRKPDGHGRSLDASGTTLSEDARPRPEWTHKAMGLIKERKRNSCCLACSSIDVSETTVLIAMRNMNLRQYDRGHFLDH